MLLFEILNEAPVGMSVAETLMLSPSESVGLMLNVSVPCVHADTVKFVS